MSHKGAIVVSGDVLDVTTRQGISAATQQPWAFTLVSVLAGKSVQEVRWDSDTQGGVPSEGDNIAVEVKLGSYKGNVQCSAIRYSHPVAAAKTA